MCNYVKHFFTILKQAFIDPLLNPLLHAFNLLYIPSYFKDNNINTYTYTYNYENTIPKTFLLCYKTKSIPSNILTDISKLNPGWNIELYDNM